ncbi:uncharacterized protein [Narcine bancroftii]|uniref:uncharacterized protein isoform X2 n=1 Tax=Narcine bancroftii TaxID=1343680 RepID=UPI003831104C
MASAGPEDGLDWEWGEGGGLVNVGGQIHRWNRVKNRLKLQDDEAMARTLLDAFVKIHRSQVSPRQTEFEGGVETHAGCRKGDAVHCAGPCCPSAAIAKARKLAARTAWKKARPEESRPKGRRSRSGRFVENQKIQPGSSFAFLRTSRNYRGTNTCEAITEQVDLDSFPSVSPSADSESTVTLSHPSSAGSFEDTDGELFSGTDSLPGSLARFPVDVVRRSRVPVSVSQEEEEEWEPGGAERRLERDGWRDKEALPRIKGADSIGRSKRLPKGLEKGCFSNRDIVAVCIGEGVVSTCHAIKQEQEEMSSLPSPTESVFSGTTVTLSHPSSDVSLEAAMLRESEAEGAETRGLKRHALPGDDPKGGGSVQCDWPGLLDIGVEINRWNSVKGCLRLRTDEEMAGALLDLTAILNGVHGGATAYLRGRGLKSVIGTRRLSPVRWCCSLRLGRSSEVLHSPPDSRSEQPGVRTFERLVQPTAVNKEASAHGCPQVRAGGLHTGRSWVRMAKPMGSRAPPSPSSDAPCPTQGR